MKVVYYYHIISPTGEELEVISSMPKNFKYRYSRKTLAKKMRAWYKKNITCPELFEKTCIIIGAVIDPDIYYTYVYPQTIYKRIDSTQDAMARGRQVAYRYN